MISDVASEDRTDKRPARVFISYSRKDMKFADQLDAALKTRGFETLIDRNQIYAFADWWQSIEALIARADTVVFVLSPDAVASDVVLEEVGHAASLNKRLAPLVYRRVEDSDLPEALPRSDFIFFDDPDRFEESANRLASALQVDIVWIRQHTEYGETAHRWAANGRPEWLLLRPPALWEAERWIASRPSRAPAVAAETLAFFKAGRQVVTRTRRRLVALLSILVLAVGAGLAAWWNQDRLYLLATVNPLRPEREQALKPTDTFKECRTCPDMIVVPAGTFMMGSPASRTTPSEQPRHKVTIAKPFAIAKYELTFDEWDACATLGKCSRNISDHGFGRGRQPVINVTLDDARGYIAWLSHITGKKYRLLSEAEFEYAARGGRETTYYWGNDVGANNANCKGCGSLYDFRKPASVGSFAPNGFGLYDMAGNVNEWTEDCYNANYNGAPADGSAWTSKGDCNQRMTRGGSWYLPPTDMRPARRLAEPIDKRSDTLGFRVARTAP